MLVDRKARWAASAAAMYCGNGRRRASPPRRTSCTCWRATGHRETGVDLDKIVECVWLLERMLGRTAFGHVSKAGPRPTDQEVLRRQHARRGKPRGSAAFQAQARAPMRRKAYSPWSASRLPAPTSKCPESTNAITGIKPMDFVLRRPNRDPRQFGAQFAEAELLPKYRRLGPHRRMADKGLHGQARRHGPPCACACRRSTAARATRSSTAASCARRSAAATTRSATSSPMPSTWARWLPPCTPTCRRNWIPHIANGEMMSLALRAARRCRRRQHHEQGGARRRPLDPERREDQHHLHRRLQGGVRLGAHRRPGSARTFVLPGADRPARREDLEFRPHGATPGSRRQLLLRRCPGACQEHDRERERGLHLGHDHHRLQPQFRAAGLHRRRAEVAEETIEYLKTRQILWQVGFPMAGCRQRTGDRGDQAGSGAHALLPRPVLEGPGQAPRRADRRWPSGGA